MSGILSVGTGRVNAFSPRDATRAPSRGYGPDGFQASMDLLTPSVASPLALLGLAQMQSVTVEHAEDHADLLAQSVAAALARVETLVGELQGR